MSSLLDVRLGNQEPQILHRPPGVVSLADAEDAIELADAYGVCDGNPLAESQKITLRNALGTRADGSWAATRVGDFGPRQGTGKNDKIAARELAGLILFGERLLIHTAHEFPTANESFLRLVAVFEAWDDLRQKVQHIYYANGAQSIHLRSGQRLLYKARTGGSGRGFAKADLVVYDEAQHLLAEHVAASGPARLANPNAQSWYAGSGGLASSSVAWAMRRAALRGSGGRLAYTEMTGETISVDEAGTIRAVAPDPADRDVWYRCIPGLGRWVTEEGVESLSEELGDLFPREGLCVWDPEPGVDMVSELPAWAGGASQQSSPVEPFSFSFDVSADQQWGAFAMCGASSLGGAHAEVADHRPGTGWMVERAKELQATWRRPFAYAVGSPAASLVPELEQAGVDLAAVSPAEHRQACGALFQAVQHEGGGRFWHRSQAMLNAAVAGAAKKESGDAWLWSRKASTVDICPLVAVTLAHWQYLTVEEVKPVFAY